MSVRTVRVLPASLVALLVAVPGSAQTAESILEAAVQRHADRMRDVQNYLVVYEPIMGMPSGMSSYFERVESEGPYPVYRMSSFASGGAAMQTPAAQASGPALDPSDLFELAENASYEGREDVEGRSAHKIVVEDLSEWDAMSDVGQGQQDFVPERGVFYVDTEDLVVTKLVFSGKVTMEGQEQRDVTNTILLSDYREVKGMIHPFRTEVTMEGMTGAGDLSEDEVAEAMRSLDQMRAELERMPEAQRNMIEGMMSEQIKALEAMVAGGSLRLSLVVRELRVNEGPPSR